MIDDIHSRKPVNKTAAIVVAPGVHYEPDKKVHPGFSELPILTRTFDATFNQADNLTGRVFGRLTVIGLAKDIKGRWVCRCVCGNYVIRSAKAAKNPANNLDACDHCRHRAYVKRNEEYRQKVRMEAPR